MINTDIVGNVKQYEEYLNERFICTEELNQVLQIMKSGKPYKILIVGPAGCGKTTLLHMLSHYTERKESYRIISAYEMQNNNFYPFSEPRENSLFIDGLDELRNPDQLLQQFNIQNKRQLICTSRFNITNCNFFTHIVTFKPLTHSQIMHLLNKMHVDISILPLLVSNLKSTSLTPRDILSVLLMSAKNLNLSKFYSKYNNLLYQYGNGLDFSSGIIMPKNRLIIPSEKITKDITIVNDRLLKQAQQNPKIMYSFTSREFEQMVCELLEKQGYKVKLTKQTRDGGKDIIILEKSLVGEFCIYVECKKYSANNPISVKLVRELYGTVEAEKATAGMLITTSYFTKDAKEFTEKAKHRMTLRDYNDLVQELNMIKY